MKQGYICNRYPFLRIGARIQFQDGLFETEDADLQAMVEANEWFNLHIHPRDTTEPAMDAPPVRAGRRSTR